MEFSFRVTEKDYLAAWKLRMKASRSNVRKTVLFWVFILVCLTMLWVIVQRKAQLLSQEQQQAVPSQPVSAADKAVSPSHALLVNVGPFALIAAVWVLLLLNLGPKGIRRMYRKDPTMQGEFTVNITHDSISTQNTAGTSSKSQWSIYSYWREGTGIIVLFLLNGAYFVLSLAGLSDAQRDELRGILATALQKK